MKISDSAKEQAVDYLISISQSTSFIPSIDKDRLKIKVLPLIKKSEAVLGQGHAILWFKNEKLIDAIKSCVLQPPEVFSVILRGNFVMGSKAFHDEHKDVNHITYIYI